MPRTRLLPRLRRSFLPAVLLWVVGACGDSTGSVPFQAAGSYALVSVNGGSLPVRIAESQAEQVDLIRGHLIVAYDGSYREEREQRITDSAGVRKVLVVKDGTIRISGGALEVREQDGGTYPGTFANSLTEAEISYTEPFGTGDATYTYRKN